MTTEQRRTLAVALAKTRRELGHCRKKADEQRICKAIDDLEIIGACLWDDEFYDEAKIFRV